MKICLITEGSYPYILGGVSSWINNFISNSKEYEFIIYSISSGLKSDNTFKYKIPSNVIEIKDIFLGEINVSKCKTGKEYNLSKEDKDILKDLLLSKNVNWSGIFEFFKENKFKKIGEFFMSKDFYGIVMEAYKEKYPFTPFTEFLWNIRSMYVTLFYLLMQDIPKADIYHSVCTGYSGVLASYGKYLYDSPFILSEHGIYTREREEEIIKSTWIKPYHKELWIDFFMSLSKCAYEDSDIVTSLFLDSKKAQVRLGCQEDKIQIIPNGVDIKAYEGIKGKDNNHVINIGAIVRIVPIKDIKTMLLSFKIVKEKILNTKYYIMGPIEENKEYYEECIKLIEEFDIKDVEITGSVNVKDYIGKMDMLVLTSISEGQPLAVIEGMLAKKPHVCTNVGHCRGLLQGDEDDYGLNGFIEHVTDYIGIANSIIKLAKDEKLRNIFGNNGYKRVCKFYDRKNMLDNYKKIYNKCLEVRHGRYRI